MARSIVTCLVAALLLPMAAAARKAPPPPPGPDPVTARMVVDRQLAARAKSGPGLNGIEARRIYDRYLSRIGVPIETQNNDTSNGRGNQ